MKKPQDKRAPKQAEANVKVSPALISELHLFQSIYQIKTHKHLSLRSIVEQAVGAGLFSISPEAYEEWKKVLGK